MSLRNRLCQLALATLAAVTLTSAAEALETSHPFYATIANEALGPSCLAFGENGQRLNPERIRWNLGDEHCGLGRDQLLRNRQALFRFTPLGNGLYTIENASKDPTTGDPSFHDPGSYECLVFDDNGQGEHPSRFVWGPGEACGYPGGVPALLQSRLAVWELVSLDPAAETYLMISRSRQTNGEYLTFNPINDVNPRRRACDSQFPCAPWSAGAQQAQPQAVWKIQPVRLDAVPAPADWIDRYVSIQNVLHSNQVLGADPSGTGPFLAGWSTENNHRFRVLASDDGDYFFLENARSGKRLAVSADGSGTLEADFAGATDAFKWFLDSLEETRPSFTFRSKLYPDQRLAVRTDGDGQPAMVGGTVLGAEQYRWKVTSSDSPTAPLTLEYQTFFTGHEVRFYDLIFENAAYPDLRLGVAASGDMSVVAEDTDPCEATVRWRVEVDETSGKMWLWSRAFEDQRLNIGGSDPSTPSANAGPVDPKYLWQLQPSSDRKLRLQNPSSNRRIQLDGSQVKAFTQTPLDGSDEWHVVFQPLDACGAAGS